MQEPGPTLSAAPAFWKKIENHVHNVALHAMFYNFCRIYSSMTIFSLVPYSLWLGLPPWSSGARPMDAIAAAVVLAGGCLAVLVVGVLRTARSRESR
jgi:hypothetical protein